MTVIWTMEKGKYDYLICLLRSLNKIILTKL